VKPWLTIGRAQAPAGGELILQERDGEFAIRLDGYVLMSSRAHGSEDDLARLGCERLEQARHPRVLIGGLGLGYTVRAALDRLPATAWVGVAELVGAVIDWNRGPVAHLAGDPLSDTRAVAEAVDVAAVLARGPGGGLLAPPFDAVLLDVDNGPAAFTRPANATLYGPAGLARSHAALAPGGVLAVWSPAPDAPFVARLRGAGFEVRVEQVAPQATRPTGARHTLFLATRR
jgi:spermidine synthase